MKMSGLEISRRVYRHLPIDASLGGYTVPVIESRNGKKNSAELRPEGVCHLACHTVNPLLKDEMEKTSAEIRPEGVCHLACHTVENM